MKKLTRALCCLVFALAFTANFPHAQQSPLAATTTTAAATAENISYDAELMLLASSSSSSNTEASNRLPPRLETVVKSLRASLPQTNYRLAMTLLNRVQRRNNPQIKASNLEVKGTAFGLSRSEADQSSPTFFDFSLDLTTSDALPNEGKLNVNNFRFSIKLPVATTRGGNESPVVTYETIGITTNFDIRENVPTIIGTLQSSSSQNDEPIIVVLLLKRAP